MTYVISDKDVMSLRVLATAGGAQGSGKRRDFDVAQNTLRGILSRLVEVDEDDIEETP